MRHDTRKISTNKKILWESASGIPPSPYPVRGVSCTGGGLEGERGYPCHGPQDYWPGGGGGSTPVLERRRDYSCSGPTWDGGSTPVLVLAERVPLSWFWPGGSPPLGKDLGPKISTPLPWERTWDHRPGTSEHPSPSFGCER